MLRTSISYTVIITVRKQPITNNNYPATTINNVEPSRLIEKARKLVKGFSQLVSSYK